MHVLIALGVLCAGAGIAVQMPMVSLTAQRLGVLQGMLIVNVTGLAGVALVLLFRGELYIRALSSLPWYVYLAGPLGIGAMATIALAIPRIGISSALVLSIAAQLIVGALLDRAGFVGLEVRTVDLPRAVGMSLVVLGAWLAAR